MNATNVFGGLTQETSTSEGMGRLEPIGSEAVLASFESLHSSDSHDTSTLAMLLVLESWLCRLSPRPFLFGKAAYTPPYDGCLGRGFGCLGFVRPPGRRQSKFEVADT